MSITSAQLSSKKWSRSLDILLPSTGGLVLYVFLSLLTLLIHYVSSIQHFLDLSGSFAIKSSLLNFLNNILVSIFGTKISNSLVLGLFWAFVGIVVYIFVQGIAVIFQDLGRDLEERKYILPSGADRNKPLKQDIEHAVFRTAVSAIFLFYLIYIFGYFLRGKFYGSAPKQYWASLGSGVHIILLFLGECLALHGIIIFLRLLRLRRRIFE